MADFIQYGKKPTALLPPGAKVESFEIRNLRDGKAPSYQAIKAKFDPEAVVKTSRFLLSEHVANQLSVEQEDQMRFEKRVDVVVQERLTALSEDSRKKAHEEGLEKGRTEAFESEKARFAKEIEIMTQAAISLVKAKQLLAEQYEGVLLEIAFRTAKIIVNHEIQNRPEAISATLVDILNRISKEDDVMVYLSTAEYGAIDQIQKEIAEISRSGRVAYQIDQRLEAGSCTVESLSGEISSSIKERFKQLEEHLLANIKTVISKAEGA